jgi:hypothetical protein
MSALEGYFFPIKKSKSGSQLKVSPQQRCPQKSAKRGKALEKASIQSGASTARLLNFLALKNRKPSFLITPFHSRWLSAKKIDHPLL